MQMKASMAELQPPEVRILKHLLSMEDPLERQSGMEQAFTPGPELNAGQEDMLSTCVAARVWQGAACVREMWRLTCVCAHACSPACSTPEALVAVMTGVLNAYEAQRGRATMAGQAAEFMTPQVIDRMRLLQAEVREKFM
jgi:hypothetical protein